MSVDRSHRTPRRLGLLATIALATAGCASAAPPPQDAALDETARGREQLIRAIDAAWIRVIASGKDQEILKTEPQSDPGKALDYMVRLVDCLPHPELAPWPEEPVGLFKEILDRGTIRRVTQAVPETPKNTSWYFSGISQKYFEAVLAEIGAHYNVKIAIEDVALPPGTLPATSEILAGRADIVGQLNATGGESQGMRRRTSRRFSCTLSASSQYIHIPEKSELVGEIKSLNDLIARPEVAICAGPLTTQTARAYMPEHKITTKYVNDLPGCDKEVESGKSNVIMNPLPSLEIGGIDGYVSVPTNLVAGTPIWVAKEGIECPDDGDPKAEDQCHEVVVP